VKRTARLALRNLEFLRSALRHSLPPAGRVVELGSGTGEHAVAFARAFPGLEWQPSDPDPDARASIAAWAAEARLPNLRSPLDLELGRPAWRRQAADALLCVNVLHVAPWAAARDLLIGAAGLLPRGGPLVVYGPFRRGRPSPRLARFDEALKAHDPALSIPVLALLLEEAAAHGLAPSVEEDGVEEGDVLLVLRRPS
jgi:Protein of unknown function (DUF938)